MRAEHRRLWRRQQWMVALCLSAITMLMAWSPLSQRLDLLIQDVGVALWAREASAPDVVVIAIDDASLQRIGRWPWRRSVHAALLERLKAAQPRAVLLNLVLSEPDPDPQQDDALVNAMLEVGSVVLPVGMTTDATGIVARLPATAYRPAVTLGHGDMSLDGDGVLRRMDLYAGTGDAWYPHLALAVAQMAQLPLKPPFNATPPAASPADQGGAPGDPEGPHAAPDGRWHRLHRLNVDYRHTASSIDTVSYADVLSGALPMARLKGKIVLIGATAAGLGDRVQTPVSAPGVGSPSTVVIAQMIDMLQEGEPMSDAPPWLQVVLPGLGMLLLLGALSRQSPRRALATVLMAGALAVIGAWLALQTGWWMPPGSFVLALVLAYPVWSWRRLETASQLLAHEAQQLKSLPDVVSQRPANAPAPSRDPIQRQIDALSDATRQLALARHLLDDILQALPCAVLVSDQSGELLRANLSARQLLGLPEEDRLDAGHSVLKLLTPWTPSIAPHWRMLLERALTETKALQFEAQGPDGDQQLVGMVPMQGHGDMDTTVVICLTDVSALRQAERHRDELLGFIAHDIRSPQASLIALTHLQRLTPPALSHSEAINHVEQLAQGTLSLCEELLQIMRSESRPLERTALDLLALTRQAVQEVSPQALERQITIELKHPASGRAIMQGDSAQLRRALTNLLSNAIKFSPPGQAVTVRLGSLDEGWTVQVQDRGAGIPPEMISRLFRRFDRLDEEKTAKPVAGVGLGLVFVDTVMRRHGGHVSVQSAVGQGTTFSCWVPADAP